MDQKAFLQKNENPENKKAQSQNAQNQKHSTIILAAKFDWQNLSANVFIQGYASLTKTD